MPKSRLEFWKPKLEANRKRDSKNQRLLREKGWRLLVVWECQLADEKLLKDRIMEFLEDTEC
jgi:DNA mismatch endonuclease (patch repair protein)